MVTENLQTEIVIVGGGGAGMAAALTAMEKGCSNVIVVEKAGSPGGNSAMAHDLFGTESPVQIRMGTDARRDHFFRVSMQWSHWSKVNPRIVNDKEYVINAKCVIMTTGGYAENKEMMQKYCSYYHPDAVDNTGVPSNTGDGILMAIEVGAATAGLGHLMFRGPMQSTKRNSLLKIGD